MFNAAILSSLTHDVAVEHQYPASLASRVLPL